MKKVLCFTICFFTLLSLCSCSLFYAYDLDVNGMDIGYGGIENNAYIGSVYWNIGDEPVIVLPDEYNGYIVEELGGFHGRGVPCPFEVVVDIKKVFPDATEYYSTDAETYGEITETNQLIEYTLQVTLPKYLKEVAFIWETDCYQCAKYQIGDTTINKAIILRCYFTISEENEYFYTENGKLYYKDGTLVEDLTYGELTE